MGSVWDEIWSARWAADVGLPLLGTFLAIGAAVLGIRRQLSHDRELWRAQRRTEAVRELASALLDAHAGFESEFWSQFWKEEGWVSYDQLRDAIQRARVILGHESPLREIMRGVGDVSQAWTACQKRKEKLIAKGMQISDQASASAIQDVLLEQIWALQSVAEVLMRWDGISSIPRIEWPVRHIPMLSLKSDNGDRVERRSAWRKFFADSYEESVR